jgi:hypothetical protein
MEPNPEDCTNLPWVCPECFAHLADAGVSQDQARVAFRSHAGGAHWKARKNRKHDGLNITEELPRSETRLTEPVETRSEPPSAAKVSVDEYWCPKSGCTWRGAIFEVDRHLLEAHDGSRSAGVLARQLPLELLPPGRWLFDHVIDHYRRISAVTNRWGDRTVDNSRFEAIRRLNPFLCWVGKKAWMGYVTFEFSDYRGVILECPIVGNATYIVGGDWKRMISLTKAEIRDGCNSYERLNHTSRWSENLRTAMRRFR